MTYVLHFELDAACGIKPNDPKKSQFLVLGVPEIPGDSLAPPLGCFDKK